MIGIVAFHILMLLLCLGIATRIVPAQRISDLLGYLHTTIGITTPRLEQVRMIALIWIGSTVLIVDGCLLLLLFIASKVSSG
ncbi:MAG: hypothetical protein LAO30_12600 [Acidobacteriia bacterium]|nr:hypothetical protein [Terriglobia bacterium]